MPSPLKVPARPSNLPPALSLPKAPNLPRAASPPKAPVRPSNRPQALNLPKVPSRLRATFLPSSLPQALNRLRVASLRKTRQPRENLLADSPPVPARLSAHVLIIAACHPARALLAPAIPCPV